MKHPIFINSKGKNLKKSAEFWYYDTKPIYIGAFPQRVDIPILPIKYDK